MTGVVSSRNVNEWLSLYGEYNLFDVTLKPSSLLLANKEPVLPTYAKIVSSFQVQQKQGAKIGLKISVNAPQILIPCNSRSSEKLIADLGQLHIANSIVSSSHYGLIDRMDVRLSSFQISGYAEHCV